MSAVGRLVCLARSLAGDITAWDSAPTPQFLLLLVCAKYLAHIVLHELGLEERGDEKKGIWLTWVALTNRVGRSRLSRELLERAPLKRATTQFPSSWTTCHVIKASERESHP
ncbi:uncharacterized protein BKA55DRAFT_562726 [Fusarium redolens]|uniref:Uncharacterized protein n=1 Tax=Fusarium redolens TaxID=48865 RepID=A0A9P9HMA1_FUSRE|nr:uncharacterized protein BKA55DRAFT_562726 [Fusarium redolens]KAH7259538.1 hypothetical protein BKA55DRAFT_562726 [Fusarium redolens]